MPLPAVAEEERRTVRIPNSQLQPMAWSAIGGWAEDDHLSAFGAFMTSCRAILRSTPATRKGRPLYAALHEACREAADAKPRTRAAAREFFVKNFRPVRISPLGEELGFITGYYEPVVEGSLKPSDVYSEPLYKKPPGLLKGGKMVIHTFAAAKKGSKTKKKVRKVVPFHSRAAIEDGALSGRNLEIAYLKDPIDAFFIQIQGSARVRLEDGSMMRVNYDAQNGHPYTAVGRFLIERNIVTREEMSMQKIREYMEANPEDGRELRRKNKSFVFFRKTDLGDKDEPPGAQGVPLTPWRSIAVDRNLHVYGTPFFISAHLPIEGNDDVTFQRLMVAQDTGGAIVGPARADIYFGAGDEAGRISGRLKHGGTFVMLFPNSVDPAAPAKIPLPPVRPDVETLVAKAAAAEKAQAKAGAADGDSKAASPKQEKAKAMEKPGKAAAGNAASANDSKAGAAAGKARHADSAATKDAAAKPKPAPKAKPKP